MTDEGGGDEKIVAVPIPKLTQRYADVRNYTDLPEITWRQIEHFFAHYKDLEGGKWVTFAGWGERSGRRSGIPLGRPLAPPFGDWSQGKTYNFGGSEKDRGSVRHIELGLAGIGPEFLQNALFVSG